ncbi:TPA: hypothetical protein EYG84_02145 [Candidatus Gracilibacteria bacterium]|nr:hypothetical protein [Candidatus Gracilibacteria bacterium]
MYKKPTKPSIFFNTIKHFLTLPFGRKILFSFSFLGLISLFFPWFYEGLKMFNIFGKFLIIGIMLLVISSLIAFISIRETFFFKKYFLGLPHYYALLLLLIAGLYTLILQTSALYELLNYNPRAYVSFGGMVLFFSYGLSLAGLLISKTFRPIKPKEVKQKKPEDINISSVSLNVE